MDLLEAQKTLQDNGLIAKLDGNALLIAANFTSPDWIWVEASRSVTQVQVSDNASLLMEKKDGSWLASFPGPGITGYDVPGELSILVSLVLAVYTNYRLGGTLRAAFEKSVKRPPGPEVYLVGI